jgi:hypothetical protein
MKLTRLFLLPLLAALPAVAQAPESNGFDFAVGFMAAQGQDAKEVTKGGSPQGKYLGFGYRFDLPANIGGRLHGDFLFIKGKDGSGMENDKRPHFVVGMDVLKPMGKFTAFGGITATTWKQSNQVTDSNFNNTTTQGNLNANGGNNQVTGMKLGYRVGVEYTFAQQWAASVMFSQTEMNKLYNPAYLSIGVNYRF